MTTIEGDPEVFIVGSALSLVCRPEQRCFEFAEISPVISPDFPWLRGQDRSFEYLGSGNSPRKVIFPNDSVTNPSESINGWN
jgi:hypothetical protein